MKCLANNVQIMDNCEQYVIQRIWLFLWKKWKSLIVIVKYLLLIYSKCDHWYRDSFTSDDVDFFFQLKEVLLYVILVYFLDAQTMVQKTYQKFQLIV